jgi:hypothetical protein
VSTENTSPRTTEVKIGRHKLTITRHAGKCFLTSTMADLLARFDGCGDDEVEELINEFEARAIATVQPKARKRA